MKHLEYTIYLILLVSQTIEAGGAKHNKIEEARLNVTNNANTTSPWLKRIINPRARAQAQGCWNRPWICSGGQFPPRRLCCMNRCIDIMFDPLNCGFCGVRCPFTWQCCNGMCINVNINPYHCGGCYKRCGVGRPCVYGLCGYAQPFPPFPFPPTLPGPPFPFPFPLPPTLPGPPFPFPLPPGSPTGQTSQQIINKE
ncbi:stigma-specific STIG1-like protein 4 [Spinacia oleracea]|uniref:Stigma-specific STIG1-like protein 4 n=1 Tax=Spinacia oleracea TaxID=3562 RepID=A0ABM3RSC6_SPIOL|nr:stigma-specific STIG1-like protein 4 [Spinacia oleracea]